MNSKTSKFIRKSIKFATGFEGKDLKKAIKLAKYEYKKASMTNRAKIKSSLKNNLEEN